MLSSGPSSSEEGRAPPRRCRGGPSSSEEGRASSSAGAGRRMAEGRAPPRHGGLEQRLRGPAPARRPRAAPSSRPRRCRGELSSSEEGRAPPRERAAAWPRAELLRDGAEVRLPHLTELGATWDSKLVHRIVANWLLSVSIEGPFNCVLHQFAGKVVA
jgi:hypothetical protein